MTTKWTTTEPEEPEVYYWFTGSADAVSALSKTEKPHPMEIEDSIASLVEGGWSTGFYFLVNLRGNWYGPLEPPGDES